MPKAEVKKKKPAPETKKPRKGRTMLGGAATEVNVKPFMNQHRKLADGRIVAEAVVVFGRMNPPTVGHERLCEAAANIAEEVGGVPILALSQTVNSKNPLTFSEKLDLCEQAFGDSLWIAENRVTGLFELLKLVAEDFTAITMVCGSDNAADFKRILEQYNGKEFVFERANLVVVDRDFDSDTIQENASASTARSLVVEEDLASFRNILPLNLRESAESVFKQVKFGLTVQKVYENGLDKARKAVVNLRSRK